MRSWLKHRASATSQRSLPQSCCRQCLTLLHIRPFSLAASSHSLSNKFREGIAAREFQRSQQACLHKLQIWLRWHQLPGRPRRSSALPSLTTSRVLPQVWGGFHSESSILQEQTLIHKKYLTDPGYSTVRKRVKPKGVIHRCDHRVACLLRPGGAQPICLAQEIAHLHWVTARLFCLPSSLYLSFLGSCSPDC